MASHPLNYEPYPEVAPSGGPEAREQIHADPDMFGAAIGRGLSQLGQGAEKASDTGFDYSTMLARQDDSSHANETNAWFAKQTTDLSEKFISLRGKDAEMELPNYQAQIDELRKQAIGQAGNPYTKQLIDNNTRQITDSSYRAAARHAGDQKATWDQNSATEKAESYGGLAAVHVPTLPTSAPIEADPTVALYLSSSDGAAKYAAQLKGLDGDVAAQRNRGKNVGEIIKTLISDGSETSLRRAASFLGSQEKSIDPATNAALHQGLKTQEAQYNGQKMADSFMGRGPALPPGYAQRTFQIESGGNPAATTGSYSGLGQFSKTLEARYGINDANRADPAVQARALSMENVENHDVLARALGHEPTPADYYLAHQQGVGGAVAHLSQPNLPAWQNMASTIEGREKGQGWAKQAVWGNMTPDMKAQFPGGVETVSSGDFARMWGQRFYQQPIQALGVLPGNGSQLPGGSQSAAMGSFPRFQMAQNFSETNKGDVVKRITNDPYLLDHPQAMNAALTYTNKIFESQNASYADMERQLHVQEQQKKLESENAENNYLKRIYAPTVNTKPLTAQEIVLDDRLSRESKDRLIKLQGDPGERDDKTYGPGFVKAFQMVHAPAGTPGRITDDNQLFDRLGSNGDLTMAGVEKLRGEINLRKTPEGNAESEMKKNFMEFAKAHISGEDLGMHITDPKGAENYMKFMQVALPAYDVGRRQGKTPMQLLSPESADYIGKGLIDQPGHGFVRPMNEWFADTVADKAGAPQSATFDVKSIKTQEDLMAAYQTGKITPQQAREFAINKKWAKPRAAQTTIPISQ